ncbi:unnamed protein product [Albugo candida]|uniref:Nucleotide-diphospho-sugar transferase domain-containing protein n=1 Tax=Albugo candida TaxID=65357 RepID=A0A024FYJ6_9STRA|nr:unnamed protein product [Albugo candida]|eukprot:CCI39581.1 unnamed protein product [Albugo candida]
MSERIKLKRVDAIPIPAYNADPPEAHVTSWLNSAYTKLHIFGLKEYQKIVYIDADALILTNIDELFDLDTNFAAAPDIFPPDRFNAGVLVVKPDYNVFQELLAKARAVKSYDGGDTGFLNLVFPDWFERDAISRLHFRYNAQRTMHWLVNSKNPGYWEALKPLKILHFSSNPKPWEETKRIGELEMTWWTYYTKACIPWN